MKLLESFERKVPLYSIVPFERLAGVVEEVPSEDRSRLSAVAVDSLAIVALLDETSEWTLAHRLLDAVERIARSQIFHPEERIGLELQVLHARLKVLERNLHGEEFAAALDRLFALALSLPDSQALRHTINALSHQYMRAVYSSDGGPLCDRLEKEIEALVRTDPSVVRTPGYVRCIGWRTERASLTGDWAALEEVERHVEELVGNPDLPGELRAELKGALCTNFLLLVRTPAEYGKRLARIEEADVERKGSLTDVSWLLQKARFYGFTGHFKRQWETYARAIVLAEKRGQRDVAASLAESLVKCRVALGSSLDEAERTLLAMRSVGSADCPPAGDGVVVNNLAAIAMMRGEAEWAIRFYDRYFHRGAVNPTALPVLLGLYRSNPARALNAFGDHPWIGGAAVRIGRVLAGDGSDEDWRRTEEFLEENLTVDPVATRHILHLHFALRLHALLRDSGRLAPSLLDEARAGLRSALAWADERELWPVIEAYLNDFGNLLEGTERSNWKDRAAEARESNRTLLDSTHSTEGKGRLTMFGAIRCISSADESVAPRGQRLKTLLGVMVANEILGRRLERDEFLRIASGHTDDPRHARDIVNKTVSRLREGLGRADVILTDGDTPRLNRDVVDVDLIEAMESVGRVRESVRLGTLMKGRQEIRKVFELWKGEVPYPTLYDEFFETLREEFELAVRDAAILLALALNDAGDGAEAEEVLRRLYEAVPEDAEIGELLARSLEANGRKVEAMRMRRAAEAVQ